MHLFRITVVTKAVVFEDFLGLKFGCDTKGGVLNSCYEPRGMTVCRM